jgi:hypothetical protein
MSTWPIDWHEMMEGYNRIHGTEYRNVKKFIIKESAKHTNDGFADLLGVHRSSVDRVKQRLKITRSQLGHVTQKEKMLELARSGKIKNMTALEISEAVGYLNTNNVYYVARDYGIEFKRVLGSMAEPVK